MSSLRDASSRGDAEVGRVRAMVCRTIDEEDIACLKDKLEEHSPHPITEEEAEEWAREEMETERQEGHYEKWSEQLGADVIKHLASGRPDGVVTKTARPGWQEKPPQLLSGDELQALVLDRVRKSGRGDPDSVARFASEVVEQLKRFFSLEQRKAAMLEQFATGEPDQVEECKRGIQQLEASKTSNTVPAGGRARSWKEAIEFFRGMPEQALVSYVYKDFAGAPGILARLELQLRRPDLRRVKPDQSTDAPAGALRRTLELKGRVYSWIDEEAPQATGSAGNEEIGRKAESRGRDFLQGKLGDQADVILRGGQGEPDLEVPFRSPQSPREFVAVKSTQELRTKNRGATEEGRRSVTYSGLATCPEATEARRHGRPYFYLLVEDRNRGRWYMRAVPVGTQKIKVSVTDFGKFELPRAFGR